MEQLETLVQLSGTLQTLIDQARALEENVRQAKGRAKRNQGLLDIIRSLDSLAETVSQLKQQASETLVNWESIDEEARLSRISLLQQTYGSLDESFQSTQTSYDTAMNTSGTLYETIALLQQQNKTLETSLALEKVKSGQLAT